MNVEGVPKISYEYTPVGEDFYLNMIPLLILIYFLLFSFGFEEFENYTN